jgi:hypothetical protein
LKLNKLNLYIYGAPDHIFGKQQWHTSV